MKKPVVSVARCCDYEPTQVEQALRRVLDGLGGMGHFVKPGMKVYIKPNALGKHRPIEAVTTNPEVVAAAARLAFQAGASEVLIGDCPGGGGTDERVEDVYKVCGYEEVAARVGAKLVVNKTRAVRDVPGGVSAKSFDLVAEMLSADLLINISKAKTHQLCAFTGAVKNLYGTIYGRDKRKYHAVYPMPPAFNHFLIDIAETVKPGLNIMDAVIGIEGPGPAAGYPRKLGALLASSSPYALDAVAVEMIGWPQSDVMLLELARNRGLLPERLEDIDITGDPVAELRLKRPFRKPTMTAQATLRFARMLPGPLREAVQARPRLVPEKCVGCGECAAACPPHAIVMREKKPVIDYAKCIKCFCCQELCPEKAMEARKGFFSNSPR